MIIAPDRIRLVTQRLVIRPLQPDDYRSWLATLTSLGDKRNHWDHGRPADEDLTPAAFEALIRDHHRLINLDRYYLFAMFTAEEGSYIGNVSLMDVSRTVFQNGYLGYSVFHHFWRQGYGFEGCRAMILFAFDVLELHRVEAGIEVDNVASQKLAEKLGMRFEGLSKRRLLVREEWQDMLVYAMTREERDKVS